MSRKLNEQDRRNKAAKYLWVWRKTRSAKKALEELNVSDATFYRTLKYSKYFHKYREDPKNQINKNFTSTEYYWALRFAKKIKAIRLLGGKCIECGESNYFKLDFHHPNGDKEFNMGELRMKKWSSIESEISKCQLLCRNCHQMKHTDTDNYDKLKDLIEQIILRM